MTKIVKITALFAAIVISALIYLLAHGRQSARQEVSRPSTVGANALRRPVSRIASREPAPGPGEATGTVTGHLADAQDGAPLTGVEVSSPFLGGKTVTSDEAGGFAL